MTVCETCGALGGLHKPTCMDPRPNTLGKPSTRREPAVPSAPILALIEEAENRRGSSMYCKVTTYELRKALGQDVSDWPTPPTKIAHEHEEWQLRPSTQGGLHCGACGDHVEAEITWGVRDKNRDFSKVVATHPTRESAEATVKVRPEWYEVVWSIRPSERKWNAA